ncbi:expressed unknown protein [Seminavis robusta]|uniref:Coenzyme Q-binding protein COQ10 START domain-containing protein n=1 Tax=Seminavis robusta TaxID=568900 RepID=A0A9N8EXB9_9STRA|nr:expressed unknown protein [Seminavis robusta]|eukprot:Sro2658_g333910.1 n/a (186) ;mRNA; f:10602-11159
MITTTRYPSNNPTTIGRDKDRDTPSNFELSNVVVSQASIVLPFSPRTAYFAFSNFSRHSEWNPQLTKVEYVDGSRNEARWTMESYGIKFGWSTVPVRQEPNKLLVWRSVKGLQLQGRAEFEEYEEGQTRMLFTMCYVAQRKVKSSSFAGPSKRESAQLRMMLESFRDAVSKELKSEKSQEEESAE